MPEEIFPCSLLPLKSASGFTPLWPWVLAQEVLDREHDPEQWFLSPPQKKISFMAIPQMYQWPAPLVTLYGSFLCPAWPVLQALCIQDWVPCTCPHRWLHPVLGQYLAGPPSLQTSAEAQHLSCHLLDPSAAMGHLFPVPATCSC